MAFVNEVEEFGHDIQFRIGERMRIVIEDVDPKEINIDTSIIVKMDVKHVHTPKFRRITCTVWMDGEYFKKPMMGGLKQQYTTDIEYIRKINK